MSLGRSDEPYQDSSGRSAHDFGTVRTPRGADGLPGIAHIETASRGQPRKTARTNSRPPRRAAPPIPTRNAIFRSLVLPGGTPSGSCIFCGRSTTLYASPSNPSNDYDEKPADCPAMGIPHYMIVDPCTGTIQVHSDLYRGRHSNKEPYVFGDSVPFERAYGFTRPADVQMPPPPVLVIIHAGGSGIRGGGGQAVPGMRPAPGSPLPPRRTTGRPRTTRRGPSPTRPAGRLRRRRDDRRLRGAEPHPDARPPAAHAGRGVPSPQPSDHALHRTEPGRPRSSPACGAAVAPSPTSSGRPGTGSPPLRRRWISPPRGRG
ncbi:hypothetical protein ACVW19_002324 [Streptomyces sp. TE5632]